MEPQMPEILNRLTKPAKLLRFEVSSVCNYRCRFCCWPNPFRTSNQFPISAVLPLCRALIATQCYKINLTGGEPLLADTDYLCGVISAIRRAEKIDQLWLTTNGYFLQNISLCRELKSAGLDEIAISIAAETDEKYSAYTGNSVTLQYILSGVENAVKSGINVKVHVPVFPEGISNFKQFSLLIRKLADRGVREMYYFRLHDSIQTSDHFDKLFNTTAKITDGFSSDINWEFKTDHSGRPYFTNGRMKVNIPRNRIFLTTENCLRNQCDLYCQGIYSAYLVPSDSGWVVRACHRIFADRRNEYPLTPQLFNAEWQIELQKFFTKIWKYAYGD